MDVGCGSGYLCAAFYEMMDRKGRVIGIDHIQGLCDMSLQNLRKGWRKEVEEGDIQVVCGDGRLGWEGEAPYDAIHVGAGKD